MIFCSNQIRTLVAMATFIFHGVGWLVGWFVRSFVASKFLVKVSKVCISRQPLNQKSFIFG